MKKYNARQANGSLRRKYRERFKAMGCECAICHGKLGPIHYEEPSNYKYPLSFVIDEIHPISKYMLFGYNSAREAAEDWNNLQPAHYCCNAMKSDKVNYSFENDKKAQQMRKNTVPDGIW